jgi:hypothetical protein
MNLEIEENGGDDDSPTGIGYEEIPPIRNPDWLDFID